MICQTKARQAFSIKEGQQEKVTVYTKTQSLINQTVEQDTRLGAGHVAGGGAYAW